MKKILGAIVIMILMASCGPVDPNMPTMGSGERTFTQAAQVTFHNGTYFPGAICGIILLIGLPIFAIRKYNRIKAGSSAMMNTDWAIVAGSFAVAIIVFWVLVMHPIFENQYY
jgi:hypothetical protein